MSVRQSQPFTDRLVCGMLPHVGSTLLWFTASTGSFVTIDHDVPIWLLHAAWTLAWTYHIQQGLLSNVSRATHARALCRATSRCGSCALMHSVERVLPHTFGRDTGSLEKRPCFAKEVEGTDTPVSNMPEGLAHENDIQTWIKSSLMEVCL
jgi:hypothetical protein